jgi:predicted unusual protein kinase regulating ubiquinone biosynthesis (AarF/ABC1/UbiB family)
MSKTNHDKPTKKNQVRAVPASRTGRFLRMAKMAGGITGGMLAEGTRQLAAGKRPKVKDMLLTPGNAKRVADQLSAMRGAAMKVGQILSMESDQFLPKELADILGQLRANAHSMPAKQLEQAMVQAYGEDWRYDFYHFDPTPIAAASIGQVHRVTTSDKDAKLQLHEEADYYQEAKYLQRFYEVLATDNRFTVPALHRDLSSQHILAMDFVEGEDIEILSTLPQQERNRVMANLLELALRELFELRLIQSDPNFANYRYNPDDKKIVLLDFGACRKLKVPFVKSYAQLANATINGNDTQLIEAAQKLGYQLDNASAEYQSLILKLFYLALEPLREDNEYDFANSQLPERLAEFSVDINNFKEFWHAPPTDVLYLHRKIGGMFLLASRLKAKVNVHELIKPWL